MQFAEFESEAKERIDNFNDPKQEWRRLIAEFVGTYFLVMAAAGAAWCRPATRFDRPGWCR